METKQIYCMHCKKKVDCNEYSVEEKHSVKGTITITRGKCPICNGRLCRCDKLKGSKGIVDNEQKQ